MKFRSGPRQAAGAASRRGAFPGGRRVLSAVVLACSSTGGKPADPAAAVAAAAPSNTPRMTIAMITHEAPGDSFWDLIRKGAEAAAEKDNIELRYSNDPEAPNQANLVQSADRQRGRRHRASRWPSPTRWRPPSRPPWPRASRSSRSTPASTTSKPMGVQEYFGQDEKLAGEAAGERLNADGAKKVDLRHPGAGPGRARIPLRRRQAGLHSGTIEILNVNSKDMPSVESTITAKLQQDPSIDDIVALGAPIALTAVQSVGNAGSNGQDRHLRHQRRARRRDQGRRRAVGRRPAAVPAGLPRRSTRCGCTSTTRTSSAAASRR